MQTTTTANSAAQVPQRPLNANLDYERARSRLQRVAAGLFQDLIEAMKGGDADAMDRARKAYQTARNAASDLHPRDTAEIAAALAVRS